VLFSLPPAQWARFQVLYSPQPATGTGVLAYTDLAASAVNFSRDPAAGYGVGGQVKNIGEQNVVYVQVVVTLYGTDGRVVGVGQVFADPDHLAPNQSAAFQVTISDTAAEPVTYRTQFVAHAQ
jgi:hypothetical protein